MASSPMSATMWIVSRLPSVSRSIFRLVRICPVAWRRYDELATAVIYGEIMNIQVLLSESFFSLRNFSQIFWSKLTNKNRIEDIEIVSTVISGIIIKRS
jgi:hypothetical protein